MRSTPKTINICFTSDNTGKSSSAKAENADIYADKKLTFERLGFHISDMSFLVFQKVETRALRENSDLSHFVCL